MAKGVRMHAFFEAGPLGRKVAGVPDGLGADRLRSRMPASPRKEPDPGLQPAPVLPQGFEQDGTEHDVSILAAFAALDMDDHAWAIDVTHLESSDLSTAPAGPVEGHQDDAVEGTGC